VIWKDFPRTDNFEDLPCDRDWIGPARLGHALLGLKSTRQESVSVMKMEKKRTGGAIDMITLKAKSHSSGNDPDSRATGGLVSTRLNHRPRVNKANQHTRICVCVCAPEINYYFGYYQYLTLDGILTSRLLSLLAGLLVISNAPVQSIADLGRIVE